MIRVQPGRGTTARAHRVARLGIGVAVVALAMWVVARADRAPGRLGDVFRAARARGLPTSALVYTELDDWWSLGLVAGGAEAPSRPRR